MKLLAYHSTRKGLKGLENIFIRLRLRGRFSHTEIMFEPGDLVDDYMPDKTCQPNAYGAYWCASSVSFERMRNDSAVRAGELGGLRFKRIIPDPAKWTILKTPGANPNNAARYAYTNEGKKYDWLLILSFLFWFLPNKRSWGMCSEECAEMLGYDDAWRFDPCNLVVTVIGPTW